MASNPPMAAIDRVKSWAQRPAVRRVFRVVGLSILTLGAVWSLVTLELSWSEVSPGLLVLNLLVLTPANLALAAIALRINAWSLGREIPNHRSIQTVAAANVAELLPLPAGAVVRGAALMEAGASMAESSRIIILTSILTLFMTVTLSLAALVVLADPAWAWPALASAIGVAGNCILLRRYAEALHLVAMLSVRVVMLVLTIIRLSVAFATIAASISWTEAALYVVAPTLGATVAIVPAGLGVNEAIAAGLAALIAGSSASAFLAVALNRVLGLVVGATMVFVLPVLGGASRK